MQPNRHIIQNGIVCYSLHTEQYTSMWYIKQYAMIIYFLKEFDKRSDCKDLVLYLEFS